MDQLIKRIQELENPTVVGLDPAESMMPEALRFEMFARHGKTPKAIAEMYIFFNKAIIDCIFDLVPAVKPQIAMYEKYGLEGLRAYMETVSYAKEKGLLVIGDIKRGDIASTAEAYAAHIGGTEIGGETCDLWKEDFVTLSPYLGSDSMEPFLRVCKNADRGIFVLAKTSNAGSGELQDRLLEGEPLYARVADLIEKWGEETIGEFGYSRVGAVVGATHREQGEALRHRCPHTFFLVPGYGAQGGTGRDLAAYFDKHGIGIIVNSSRGITGAWKNDSEYAPGTAFDFAFAESARKAVLTMREDLRLAMEG